ncbi:MAG: isoprenylcysteine carboxylmethyltransferase family protein [Deltaproteobacteria bacterium]|nr:isoprenylcysteine carboxylmethyltransferase family protein [Deltaproteobacteria bacterium]MBI3018225.1 isoprenylcysteine carboxylmethyltransferase family protein [Deltaproteobacteria bacterium]
MIYFLALFALVFYTSIPLILIVIHKTLPWWRGLGTKSYPIFILSFFISFVILFSAVLSYQDSILSWRLYEGSWAWLGLFPLLGGILLGIITVRTLSLKVLFGLPEIDSAHYSTDLITKGIYRTIRHPRYLEFILEVLGIAILSGLVWNFILFIYMVPAVWCLSVVEERELVQRFGQSYIEYRKRVGRFFPKF